MAKINVMCDIETTGVDAGCCILSIAFVPFDTDYPLDTYYETISHLDSKDLGFKDDSQTLGWWDRQKAEIQAEAFSGTRPLKSVLESASHYLAELGEPKDIILWGNGKDFDNVILGYAFKKLGLKQPWHYKNNRCYRDLAENYVMLPKGKVTDAHNALADARAQARHAEIIFNAVRGIGGLVPETLRKQV